MKYRRPGSATREGVRAWQGQGRGDRVGSLEPGKAADFAEQLRGLTLDIGQLTEMVTVEGEVSRVRTEESSLGTVVERRRIDDRDFIRRRQNDHVRQGAHDGQILDALVGGAIAVVGESRTRTADLHVVGGISHRLAHLVESPASHKNGKRIDEGDLAVKRHAGGGGHQGGLR